MLTKISGENPVYVYTIVSHKEGPWAVHLTLGSERGWADICDIVIALYHERVPMFTIYQMYVTFTRIPYYHKFLRVRKFCDWTISRLFQNFCDLIFAIVAVTYNVRLLRSLRTKNSSQVR